MSKEKVLGHIVDLRREIEALDECDEPTRRRLADLTAEIREAINDDEADSDWTAVARKVREKVEQFEFAHPVLTSTVDRILNTLSGMGI